MVPQVKYFSLGVCSSPTITRASCRQINGSNEVSLGIPLGGNCTVPHCEMAKG